MRTYMGDRAIIHHPSLNCSALLDAIVVHHDHAGPRVVAIYDGLLQGQRACGQEPLTLGFGSVLPIVKALLKGLKKLK